MAACFLDLPDMPGQLRRLVKQIPVGRVTTCGALAEALGNPVAARWVGHFLLHHEHSKGCACHRVVLAGGRLGRYAGGSVRAKARMLRTEGVAVQGGVIDLECHGWQGFAGERPLERLAEVQREILARAVVRRRRRVPETVGGVDLAYGPGALAAAALAVVETASGRLLWSATRTGLIRFPYITSYLSFRELPLLLELLEQVRAAGRLPEVILVDGSGMLHPRRAGIATHLGVAASLATVGVTKKLLCGRAARADLGAGESCPILHEDRVVGAALRAGATSRRLLYVSPGHRVDVGFAEALVRLLLRGRRLPEPIYWADRLSRAAVKSSASRFAGGVPVASSSSADGGLGPSDQPL